MEEKIQALYEEINFLGFNATYTTLQLFEK